MIKQAHKTFLLEQAHADAARHSGRNLYQHLAGTHDLLEAWGGSEDLCAAGLFHSVYGTRRFRHQAWPLDRRDMIKELIGEPAEFLVYVFCVADRPKVLFEQSAGVFDTHKGRTLVLEPTTRGDLFELEAANLLEQGGNRYWLGRLLQENIGAAARDAIEQYMGEKRWARTSGSG